MNRPTVVAAALLAVQCAGVLATDRFFPDQTVTSENGRYRLKVSSPDNKDRRRPFADDFTYTLSDLRDNSVVWTHRQADYRERSPIESFVDDSGYVAVWTASHDLLIFDAETGEPAFRTDLLDRFAEQECEEYVRQTTAGAMWADSSLWYFARVESRPHFVVRTWWDQRIIVDMDRAVLVANEGAVKRQLDDQESEYLLGVLTRSTASAPAGDREFDVEKHLRIRTAAHLAGRMKVRAAIPALRALEGYARFDSSVSSFWDAKIEKGDVDPSNYSVSSMRQVVALSLRRLGEKPALHPPTRFRLEATKDEFPPDRPGPADRHVREAEIGEKMPVRRVLELLGAPDFVLRGPDPETSEWQRTWEYDLDSEPPKTLRIIWNEKTPLTRRIERLTPPAWQRGNERDQDLLR